MQLEQELAELEETYPLQRNVLVDGLSDVMFVKEGVIAVKPYRGTMGTREQYHWVGTFCISEFFDNEYEDDKAK